LEKLHEILSFYERFENIEGITKIKKDIGSLYLETGREDEGFKYLEEALKNFEEKKLKRNIAEIHNKIGYNYSKSNNIKLALENYSCALKIFRETGDKYNIALILDNIAAVNYFGGHFNEVEKVLVESLKLKEDLITQIAHPDTRISLRKFEIATIDLLCSVYIKKGEFFRAQGLLELRKARELSQDLYMDDIGNNRIVDIKKEKYKRYYRLDRIEIEKENLDFQLEKKETY